MSFPRQRSRRRRSGTARRVGGLGVYSLAGERVKRKIGRGHKQRGAPLDAGALIAAIISRICCLSPGEFRAHSVERVKDHADDQRGPGAVRSKIAKTTNKERCDQVDTNTEIGPDKAQAGSGCSAPLDRRDRGSSSTQVWQLLARQSQNNRAASPRHSGDQFLALQRNDHLVHCRSRHAKEPLKVCLGGSALHHLRVVVNERQILALKGGVFCLHEAVLKDA